MFPVEMCPRNLYSMIEPWYLTGVVEFAGSFTYSRTDRNVVPYFAIKLAEDEAGLLEEIRTYFGGVGRIYVLGSKRLGQAPPDGRTGSRYYRVTRVQDLDLVVSHFEEFPLRGRKASLFVAWREIVLLKRDRYRKPDRAKVDELCAALSDAGRHRT